MDSITSLISSSSFPPATSLSLFLHEWQIFALLSLCALLFAHAFLRDGRRTAFVAFTVLLCLLCAMAIKEAAKVPRSCLSLPSKAPCPSDSSLPSLHAAVAFSIALSLLGTSLFLPFLALAFLVSLSRIYLGVHTLPDISASLALAILSYALALLCWHSLRLKQPQNLVLI